MSDREFSFGGRQFKLSKIDAFKQFHIVRRIGPILSELLPAMKGMSQLKNFDELPEEKKLEHIAQFATPIMVGLSRLSDADSELVLYGLLSAVEMLHPAGGWSRVSTGSMLMIQDLELPALLQIAGRAFMYNLSGFFAGLPARS